MLISKFCSLFPGPFFTSILLTLVSLLLAPSISTALEIQQPIPVQKSYNSIDGPGVKKTEWISPDGSQPINYSEWKSNQQPEKNLEVNQVLTSQPASKAIDRTGFCIIVESEIFPDISASLDQYIYDLTGEGYSVELYLSSYGSPQELRSFLIDRYANGLQGCLFVGDLPVAWYETPDEQFPIDYFYMDMDGIFTDTDLDGMYDTHSGNVAPEIWMGRLTASPLGSPAEEITLLNNYFDKNHRYRTGQFERNNRSLVYIDDDWAPGNGWNQNTGLSYATRSFVRDRWETWGPDYMERITQDYEFVFVCVHSWSGGHAFKNPLDEWSWIYVNDIVTARPMAHFYNLFACSNSRYTEADYCGGWYIFGDDYGLGSIGSAKTGSMLYFDDFYKPFGEGLSIGQSFADWFTAQADGGFYQWEVDWYYGMSLCGDPTLTSQKKSNCGAIQHDDGSVSYQQALPHPSGWDMYNVRFVPDQPCTLSAVTTNGSIPSSSPIRLYIWESDGTFPTTVIDSVDVPSGDIGYVDLQDLNLFFDVGHQFHIGFRSLESSPTDTTWIYMDAGVVQPEPHSVVYLNGGWQTLQQIYGGQNYNFLIRAEVRLPDLPEILILADIIPEAEVGQAYVQTLDITGGTEPYNCQLSAGTLPNGLTIDPATGEFLGTVTSDGYYQFSVYVIDSSDPPLTAYKHLSLQATSICGDANSDQIVNVGDAVFLINFVFKDGAAPYSEFAGDANCDGATNVGDAVYIVNFVFKSGSAPCAACE